jgi:hypothetical protein
MLKMEMLSHPNLPGICEEPEINPALSKAIELFEGSLQVRMSQSPAFLGWDELNEMDFI